MLANNVIYDSDTIFIELIMQLVFQPCMYAYIYVTKKLAWTN
jgi:hypothetical protein